MNKPVRIPDMFLRATKRGATALLSDVSNVNSEDKKDEPVQLPIIKRPRVDGEFVLRDLLLDGDWKKSLQGELQKPYIKNIENFLRSEYAKGKKIFPPRDSIFAAFHHTPLKKVRVVIIGQDPYHDDGQAHGLSFSVPRGKSIPGSLRNIYKELATDIPGFKIPNHGNLEKWANQGVFLLNATLTVEAHQANSHSNIGWQQLTDAVIATSSRNCDKLVYVLWGGFAKKKEVLLDKKKHAIIQCAHPSPLSASRGFLGSRCFSRINEQLEKFGHKPIDWNLD